MKFPLSLLLLSLALFAQDKPVPAKPPVEAVTPAAVKPEVKPIPFTESQSIKADLLNTQVTLLQTQYQAALKDLEGAASLTAQYKAGMQHFQSESSALRQEICSGAKLALDVCEFDLDKKTVRAKPKPAQ